MVKHPSTEFSCTTQSPLFSSVSSLFRRIITFLNRFRVCYLSLFSLIAHEYNAFLNESVVIVFSFVMRLRLLCSILEVAKCPRVSSGVGGGVSNRSATFHQLERLAAVLAPPSRSRRCNQISAREL